jgi:CRP-like cAMP-binding protein
MDTNELKDIDLFAGLDADELAACSTLFTSEDVLMGDKLTGETDFGYSFFVVLSGEVKVLVDDEEVARLGPGDHFGEVSLVTGERRNATVTATERCRLAKMMTWDFQKLIDEHPKLADRIRSRVDERRG